MVSAAETQRIFVGTSVQEKVRSIPVAYQQSHWGAALMADVLHQGGIVVPSFGATYGTAFLPEKRLEAAKRRKEDLSNLETVSVVADAAIAPWVLDEQRIHYELRGKPIRQLLTAVTNISFIRFPARVEKAQQLSRGDYAHHYINSHDEIQIFPVENDLVLNTLMQKHGRAPMYLVRSSNITGEPEKYTYLEALQYAEQINADLFAPLREGIEHEEQERRRIQSQPIIRVVSMEMYHAIQRNPQNYPGIDPDRVPHVLITRLGNTHEFTLTQMLRHTIPFLRVAVLEEKPNKNRHLYSAHNVENKHLKRQMLRASRITQGRIEPGPRFYK